MRHLLAYDAKDLLKLSTGRDMVACHDAHVDDLLARGPRLLGGRGWRHVTKHMSSRWKGGLTRVEGVVLSMLRLPGVPDAMLGALLSIPPARPTRIQTLGTPRFYAGRVRPTSAFGLSRERLLRRPFLG